VNRKHIGKPAPVSGKPGPIKPNDQWRLAEHKPPSWFGGGNLIYDKRELILDWLMRAKFFDAKTHGDPYLKVCMLMRDAGELVLAGKYTHVPLAYPENAYRFYRFRLNERSSSAMATMGAMALRLGKYR
jgi:hypothetical protein